MPSNTDLHELWARYLADTASATEARALLESVAEDTSGNEHLAAMEIQLADMPTGIIPDEAAREFVWQQVLAGRSKIRRMVWMRYAAAIIILFSTGAYLWNNYNRIPVSNTATITPSSSDILPGGQRAVLTLADGRKIILDSAANGQLAIENGNEIIKRDGQIIYGSAPILLPSEAPKERRRAYSAKALQPEGYNTMTTPRGGQYQLTLPDGTKVWLNAASQITYPTKFIGKTREVKVEGEIYFEIKPNKNQPFIVKTNSEEIEVLGTEFNVNNYPDEPASKISLISGAVKVNPSSALQASEGEGKLLQPGQAYTDGKVITTNIGQDVAWRNGLFDFNGMGLKAMMRQLEKWYDITVQYKTDIRDVKFEGKLSRDLTLSQILEILKEMDVEFSIEGRTLLVRKNR